MIAPEIIALAVESRWEELVIRTKSGRFVNGGTLPQTPQGWIDRLENTSYVCDGKKGFTNTYVSKGLNIIIWKQSPTPQQINKRAKSKAQADPVKVVKIRKQRMVHYIKYKEHYLQVFSYKYHSNPELYRDKFQDWYYNNGGKATVAEYNRTHWDKWDPAEEKAKAQARIRDGGMCKWFGCSKKLDHVHHIIVDPKRPELRYNLSNLISYCRGHHGEFHAAKGEEAIVPLILSVNRRGATR